MAVAPTFASPNFDDIYFQVDPISVVQLADLCLMRLSLDGERQKTVNNCIHGIARFFLSSVSSEDN